MSHHLKKVRIKNYRSIVDIELWRKGSIEQMIGIDVKNDPTAIPQKCLDLQEQGGGALDYEDECGAFCEWLNS